MFRGKKEAGVGEEKPEGGRARPGRTLLGCRLSPSGRDPVWRVLAQERQDLICILEDYTRCWRMDYGGQGGAERHLPPPPHGPSGSVWRLSSTWVAGLSAKGTELGLWGSALDSSPAHTHCCVIWSRQLSLSEPQCHLQNRDKNSCPASFPGMP